MNAVCSVLAGLMATEAAAQTVTNGSATGTVGNSMLGSLAGWIVCSQPSNNSPDVCGMSMPSWNGSVTVAAAPSPDGGSWIGLANGVRPVEQECATGEMTGLIPGNAYRLEFWGASFGAGPGMYADSPQSIVTVTTGSAEDVFTVPRVALEWNRYGLCFVAESATQYFTLQTFTGDGYGSFDGFTVQPANGWVTVQMPDTMLCEGQSWLIDLTAPGASYLWHDGSTGPTFLVEGAGDYWVEVATTDCGILRDTTHVIDGSVPDVDLGADASLCEGQTLMLAPNVPGTYEWQDGSTFLVQPVTATGTYWVNVTTACGVARDTIEVNVYPSPEVDLTLDPELCIGGMFLLDATTPDGTYLWQDGSTGPTYTATEAGTYSVSVTANGCTGSGSVTVVAVDCEAYVDMPNVFSPNGDGDNDLFLPTHLQNVVSSRLSIFNRWGQVVYEATDLVRGWNGKLDGSPCPEGTYYWHLDYSDRADKWTELKGHVTLLR